MSLKALRWVALAVLGVASSASAARIEVVLLTESGFPATESRAWYQALVEMKVDNLQIRGGDSGAKAELTTGGTAADPTYRVTGILTARNELLLPDARFSARDRAGLRNWLTKLRTDGPAGSRADQEPLPFGMSPAHFALVNEALSPEVSFSTKGLTPTEVLDKLKVKLSIPLVLDRAATTALQATDKMSDELRGVAAGTALACVLRPAGLVMTPRLDARNRPECVVVAATGVKESWPVGWPTGKEREQDLVPDMYVMQRVEIDEVPLAEVTDAIGGRLKLPILFDHNAMARQGIDPAKVTIKAPSAQMMYSSTLRRALSQARLRYQMRVDEAGKPLLWVTTVITK